MTWNGLNLQSQFADLLSDDSDTFKARVSKWIRQGENDICIKHTWPFLRKLGQVIPSAGNEEVSLFMTPPTAPTVALNLGGSLSESTSYKVLLTYIDSQGVESKKGAESSSISTDTVSKTILLSGIPVSSDPLVISRKVYLSKSGGNFYYQGTISDNTTTTYLVSTETSSYIEPPEANNILKLDGDPFIQDTWPLKHLSVQQLRLEFETDYSNDQGTPEYYSSLNYDKILTYPSSSGSKTISFYYFQRPNGIWPDEDSIPTIPEVLKDLLELFVEWKGYQYRDIDGKYNVKAAYQRELQETISKYGKSRKGSGKVRQVTYGSF